ncbi:MAG: hypothetical protein D6806_08465 [Deltaproteobacteria bacterium]|nr:MAG: hypothetical protein D6806_08465 [Deltaproteobacteria bacterium]
MARKYRPDGAIPAVGLVQALVAGSVVGIIVGYLLGFIGYKWMSLVLIWPLAMGAATGVVVTIIVKKTAIRNTIAAFVLGALSAAVSYAASHHVAYVLARSEFRSDAATNGIPSGQGVAKLNADDADKLFEMVLTKETGSGGFWGFVKFEAKQGSTLSRHGERGVNLGETGTWILFLLELLGAMVIGGYIPHGQASEPFCTSCGKWYEPSGFVTLAGVDKAQAKQFLENDDFTRLAEAVELPQANAPHVALKFSDCRGCDVAETAAELVTVDFRKKGKQFVRKEKTVGVYLVPRGDAQMIAKNMQSKLDGARG